MPDVLNKACQQRKILQQIAPDRLREGGKWLEYLDPRWYAARARGNTAEMKAIADKWTGREVAGCKIAAVTGTGMLVTLATGGTGFIPYAFGVSAATAAAVGLDTHIQQALAEGRVLDATKMASYHIPLLGSGRHIFDAYKKGDLVGMGFHAGMMGIEGFGLRGALKEIYRIPKQGGSAGASGVKPPKTNLPFDADPIGKQGKAGSSAKTPVGKKGSRGGLDTEAVAIVSFYSTLSHLKFF